MALDSGFSIIKLQVLPMPEDPITRLDYCQFLLSSQINYTLTHFAEHAKRWSHDTINRFLQGEKITPRLLWENLRDQIDPSPNGYLLFDDTVLDKNHARRIALVRRQYSGNQKRVIRGIGLVTCVYVNPDLDRFWIIDYRIYDPEGDAKTKLDHVDEMLRGALLSKGLPFKTVLMDTWYATRQLMLEIERLGKHYFCPLKCNRRVDDSDGTRPHQAVEALTWTEAEALEGKKIHIKDFPKGHRVKLFRLVFSTERTDFVATNDVTQASTEAAQRACGFRWRIEQVHREAKQVTGIERCQCRSQRIQRNHIGCALLVWIRLKQLAYQSGKSIYQVKFGLLSEYLIQQLKAPSVRMTLA